MVGDFFHPNVGGVENHIYMLGAQLLARGHKVIVITHSHRSRSGAHDRVGVRWLLPGLKVYHIPFPPIAKRGARGRIRPQSRLVLTLTPDSSVSTTRLPFAAQAPQQATE